MISNNNDNNYYLYSTLYNLKVALQQQYKTNK